ncbi:hypothetical protein IF2G_09259 [Cordyceps javanica]|nr:hypothetical protein IF2G_09259 [Cordyceps javanica]
MNLISDGSDGSVGSFFSKDSSANLGGPGETAWMLGPDTQPRAAQPSTWSGGSRI